MPVRSASSATAAEPATAELQGSAGGLHVEDYAYAFAQSRARAIVDRAMERDFLAVIEHSTNRVRAAFGFPPGVPLTDRERAEALLFRIALHVRRNP